MNNSILEDRISDLINTVLNNNFGRNINFISIEVIPVHTSYEASPQVNNLSNLPPYKLIRPEDDIIVNKCSCPICLEPYESGKYKRVLPCNHVFHKKCIDKWLKKKMECPVCRKKFS